MEAGSRYKPGDGFRAFFEINGQNLQAVTLARGKGLQSRHLNAARLTPGRPEVQQYGTATQLPEPPSPTGFVVLRHCGRRAALRPRLHLITWTAIGHAGSTCLPGPCPSAHRRHEPVSTPHQKIK
jgi:hypothetical protein